MEPSKKRVPLTKEEAKRHLNKLLGHYTIKELIEKKILTDARIKEILDG